MNLKLNNISIIFLTALYIPMLFLGLFDLDEGAFAATSLQMLKEQKFLIIGIGINLIKNPIINNYPTTNILKETGFKVKKYNLIKKIEKYYVKKLKLFA